MPMMTEIPELKDDLAFLKTKMWKEFDVPTKGREMIRTNFLLHPKRLSSDSECSSPRTLSNAIREQNNNIQTRSHHTIGQTVRIDYEECYIETGIGDGVDNKSSNIKNSKEKSAKKPTKVRPSTSCMDGFDRKFKTLIERSLKVLNNIRGIIEEGIAPPDGEEDFMRRTKRLQEFSSRFSRIYLYPLLRQTDELSMPEKLGTSVINQKFLCAQQIILQGLQVYHSHLPSSVGKCGVDKLKSLLDQIMYMCHLYELLKKDSNSENYEFVNALRSHVELLVEAVAHFEMKLVEKKPKSNESLKKKPKTQIQNKSKSKLSMYLVSHSFRKDMEYKKAVESLAKKRHHVKSRYKTAGFKHRPPVEKKGGVVPSKIKLFNHKSSEYCKSTPRKSPIREDDIKTMVELEAPPNTRENVNHESSIASSRHQLVQDAEIEEGKVEKALEVLRNFFGSSPENKQTDVLERIASEVDRRKEEIQEKPRKKLKELVVSVTGAKNAKLICIRDDNSLIEDDDKRDKEIMTDVEIKVASSQTQTEIKDEKKTRSKSGIKISRLPKTNRKVLTMLPKDYAINIIQYKLRYNHFHKHNPMYRKSAHIQPWVLMGRVSDELLNHVLQSLTGELEVNEILENLYNAEFQY